MDFERFRFINPKNEARMIESIKMHGQLSPVLAGRFEHGQTWVLVDGFKRLRATQTLKIQSLQVWCVECSMQVLKAMVLTVNQDDSTCRELEEALVIQSLHRDEGLQQQEIALLCNRDKSWVCRRIGLIERLSDEVLEQMRLGLVSLCIARELLRLPRGNQNRLLSAIRQHRLNIRQSRRLVDKYLSMPAAKQEALLEKPYEMVDALVVPGIDAGRFSVSVQGLMEHCKTLGEQMAQQGIGSLNHAQRAAMHTVLNHVAKQCTSYDTLLTTHR
jgi:ParB/RepB/Spo0J family partition protein